MRQGVHVLNAHTQVTDRLLNMRHKHPQAKSRDKDTIILLTLPFPAFHTTEADAH